MPQGVDLIVEKTLGNPWISSNIAIILDRISKGDLGSIERKVNSHEMRALIALSGRTDLLMEEELQ